ncbi:hypothetical protein TIFTF001_053537 [Ficus carica]|uniref:Uncharacterized protein n=1 Tax=Ficus carica TaxID=3494 RepID=A0AA88EFR1_FICCA|nr:hypothetical protein TIFTF001_053530 [Ficus carica]GMN72329.1 hypothetical protein TIFTF001_053537 [Ficus carica]
MVVVQHSSWGSMVPGEVLPGSTSIVLGEVLPRSTSMVAGKVLPESSMVFGEVLPRSISIVPREVQPGSRESSIRVKHGSWGSSTRVTRKFYPGQQAWLPGKFHPGQACLPTLRPPGAL